MSHKAEKVYVITLDVDSSFSPRVQMNFALEKQIALLAKKSGEIIYFHQYKDPIAKTPAVLLECSDAFLEKVKELYAFQIRAMPSFIVSDNLQPGTQTIRCSDAPQIETPEAMNNRPKNKGPNF